MKILLENWNKFLKEEQQKPKLFFLIGPPAVGKSTWIKNNAPKDAVVVNRDEMVETIASKAGLTYDEMYVRVPKELTPPITISKESFSDPTKEKEIENYISLVQQAAQNFNSDSNNSELVKKYGKLIPFDKAAFETVLIKFGIKPEFIVPFEYEKIKKSNEDVGAQLDLTRKQSAKDKKSIIIDMVSMSINERNMHRKFLVAAINNLESPNQANAQDIKEHYDQIAIVFAPEEGYTPEVIEQIKKVAVERASEIKATGGSKTIPPQAYDRMFSTYQPPTSEEGFKMVKNVGVPSLNKLKQNLKMEHKNMKVSKNQLRKLILEELSEVMSGVNITKSTSQKLPETFQEFYKTQKQSLENNKSWLDLWRPLARAQEHDFLSKRDYDNILNTAYQNARKSGAPADIQQNLISTIQLIIKKNTNIAQAIDKAAKHHSDLMNQDNTGGYANRGDANRSPQQTSTSAPKQSPTTGKDPDALQRQQDRDQQNKLAKGGVNPYSDYRNQGR